MMKTVEDYLALRRAAGFALTTTEYLLRSFARFAAERRETHIRTETVLDWAVRGPSVAQRDARLKAVCRLARYIRVEDDRHELPPLDYFGYRKTRRVPFIYSRDDINRLVQATDRLRPSGALRAHTYAALIALLATTGLRISEALALRVSDITSDGLLVRKSKFQKTRLVPLHDTALAGLHHYLACRRSMGSVDDHVFVADSGRPLTYHTVQSTFLRLLTIAGLSASNGRRPRLHELRHSFAVTALQECPPGRRSIAQNMRALSTYLGHTNIYSTYWYLEATPELLRDIANAGECVLQGDRS